MFIMKKEIEVKIVNIDVKKLLGTLRKLGFTRILKPTLLHELYFSSTNVRRNYSSFRLRSEGERSFLTIKTKQKDKRYKIRNEYEVEVGDFTTTKKLLEILGFETFREREKIRESYRRGSVRIEIDTYPMMQPYIEIEASQKKDVAQFLKEMNFDLNYASKKSATEIIFDAGFNPDHHLFSKKEKTALLISR